MFAPGDANRQFQNSLFAVQIKGAVDKVTSDSINSGGSGANFAKNRTYVVRISFGEFVKRTGS